MYIAIAFLLQVVVVVAAAAVAGARVVMELIKFKKTLQVSYFFIEICISCKIETSSPVDYKNFLNWDFVLPWSGNFIVLVKEFVIKASFCVLGKNLQSSSVQLMYISNLLSSVSVF